MVSEQGCRTVTGKSQLFQLNKISDQLKLITTNQETAAVLALQQHFSSSIVTGFSFFLFFSSGSH